MEHRAELRRKQISCSLLQIIDIRDVSFYPISSCKVLCAGAKPSAVSVPDKLLRLVPKVTFLWFIEKFELMDKDEGFNFKSIMVFLSSSSW